MSDLASQGKQMLSSLDQQFAGYKVLDQFESRTKLPRSYGVLGAGAAYFLLIFLNVGGVGQLLSNIAGFALPGYFSLEALNSVSTKDDTQLLTYWVVFAFLNVVEFWSKALLYWIPFYWLFKTVFLLWLSLPQFNGATFVYNSFIKPFANKYILTNSNKKIAEDVIGKVDAAGKSTGVEF